MFSVKLLLKLKRVNDFFYLFLKVIKHYFFSFSFLNWIWVLGCKITDNVSVWSFFICRQNLIHDLLFYTGNNFNSFLFFSFEATFVWCKDAFSLKYNFISQFISYSKQIFFILDTLKRHLCLDFIVSASNLLQVFWYFGQLNQKVRCLWVIKNFWF